MLLGRKHKSHLLKGNWQRYFQGKFVQKRYDDSLNRLKKKILKGNNNKKKTEKEGGKKK